MRVMIRFASILTSSLALSACSLLPGGNDAPPSRGTSSARMPVSPVAQQCLAQLSQTGSTFSPLPDRYFGAGCSTINSVKMADLRGDRAQISLGNLGPVACSAATALSGWARFGVDRAAQQMLGSRLVRIETMGSYSCRNVAGTSRRSAHSTAQAIDVSAFILADGRRVSVKEGWWGGSLQEREFLQVVHRSACKRFGTVLGPKYNAAHRDHFHLEKDGNDADQSKFCR